MPTTAEIFAKRLKEARTDAGLTQFEVAQAVGVRENNVLRWESGKHVPYATQFPDLAEALNVTTDWLLGVKGAPKRPKGRRAAAAKAVRDATPGIVKALEERGEKGSKKKPSSRQKAS